MRKLPHAFVMAYSRLISENIGHWAILLVRPVSPIKLTVKLHPDHVIQLNAGWIQSITLVEESDLASHEGNVLLKTDIQNMINKANDPAPKVKRVIKSIKKK